MVFFADVHYCSALSKTLRTTVILEVSDFILRGYQTKIYLRIEYQDPPSWRHSRP